MNGRGERIRTSGLYVPNVALYQAKLHPEFSGNYWLKWCARSLKILSSFEMFVRADHDERFSDRVAKSSRASRNTEGGKTDKASRALSASALAAARVASIAPV